MFPLTVHCPLLVHPGERGDDAVEDGDCYSDGVRVVLSSCQAYSSRKVGLPVRVTAVIIVGLGPAIISALPSRALHNHHMGS